MEMITTNLLPIGAMPVCHASQFDKGRVIRFNLVEGEERTPYTLSGTETITAVINKPDGTVVVEDIANTSSNYIDFVTSENTCDVSGFAVCKIVVKKDDKEIGGKQFGMEIEEDAYGGGADIETLTASGPIATFETNMVDNLVDLKAGIEPIQDLHGYEYPWTAGTGKNLCPPMSGFSANGLTTTVDSDGKITVSGTATGTGGYLTSFVDLARVIPSGTAFSISVTSPPPSNLQTFFDEGVGDISSGATQSNNIIRNIDITKLRLYLFTTAGQTYNFSFYYQIEIGSAATSFAPYENVCPIEGWSEVDLYRRNNNLLNDTIKYQASATYVYIGQDDANYHIFLKEGTYTISADLNGEAYGMCCREQNAGVNISLWAPASGLTSKTFTLTKTGWYRFWVYRTSSQGGVDISNVKKVQLEVGSVKTDYVAYNGNEYIINLGGTYYGAELMIDKYGHRALKVVDGFKTFTGSASENWYYYAVGTGSLFRIGVSERKSGYITSTMANANAYLCNQATKASNNTYGRTNGTFSGGGHNLDVVNNNFTDLASWKTYLASNPLQFKYELETPIIIDLPDGEPIEALLGINNVYASSGDVELKYLKQM